MVQKVPASGLENAGGNFKNLIINGDMSIFQRATATTTVSNGTYQTVDRFKLHESTDGAYTAELENLSVADQATTGQRTALELNVTTADGTIGSSQFAAIYHPIEAQFLQHILYGTSAAKDLTLSFYVKSNKTGTYCVAMDKNDNTAYRLPIEYTISSANTWEKKVIHISPTAGSTSLITASGAAIDKDNGTGMIVTFGLAWGSSYQGTNNTWVTGNAYATSNQVNWMDSTDNNFFLTGVQLEVGSGASDFEHLPHDVQLRRCQRYFQLFNDGSYDNEGLFNGTLYTTSTLYGYISLQTPMRAGPSLYEVTGTDYWVAYTNGSNNTFDDMGINGDASNTFICEVYVPSSGNLSLGSGGQSAFVRTHNAAARLGADAEL